MFIFKKAYSAIVGMVKCTACYVVTSFSILMRCAAHRHENRYIREKRHHHHQQQQDNKKCDLLKFSQRAKVMIFVFNVCVRTDKMKVPSMAYSYTHINKQNSIISERILIYHRREAWKRKKRRKTMPRRKICAKWIHMMGFRWLYGALNNGR